MFVTSDGIEIRLRKVNPVFMQSVVNSVKIPKPPTYETTTISGRKETHQMDEVSAQQLPDGESIWRNYVTERDLALAEQSSRLARAIFYTGTDCEVPDTDWKDKYDFVGVEVPTKEGELRAFYLMNELQPEDTAGLMTAIMRLTGVDEEMIQQAEDAFRDTVQSE